MLLSQHSFFCYSTTAQMASEPGQGLFVVPNARFLHMADTREHAGEVQETGLRITTSVLEAAWSGAALGSIGIAAKLKRSGMDRWANFAGQWPLTFLLFGLSHRPHRPDGR